MWTTARSLGVQADQHGGAVLTVQVFGDGGAFRDQGAVVQLQHGDSAGRVLGQECRSLVLAAGHVHVDELDLIEQALLGERDADAGGVGKAFVVVDLHGCSSGAGCQCGKAGPGDRPSAADEMRDVGKGVAGTRCVASFSELAMSCIAVIKPSSVLLLPTD